MIAQANSNNQGQDDRQEMHRVEKSKGDPEADRAKPSTPGQPDAGECHAEGQRGDEERDIRGGMSEDEAPAADRPDASREQAEKPLSPRAEEGQDTEELHHDTAVLETREGRCPVSFPHGFHQPVHQERHRRTAHRPGRGDLDLRHLAEQGQHRRMQVVAQRTHRDPRNREGDRDGQEANEKHRPETGDNHVTEAGVPVETVVVESDGI